MICDKIYCELVSKNYNKNHDKELIDNFLDDDQKKLMTSMWNTLPVLRTEYAYALIVKDDKNKAAEIKEYIDKGVYAYPYKGDIAREQGLIEYANKKAAN